MPQCPPLFAAALIAALSPSVVATENWPEFRGPNGDGTAPNAKNLPLEWSADKNIKWATEIKGRAWSSPVVWGDQVWVTNANEDGTKLSAVGVDRESGKILHDLLLFEPELVEALGNKVNGYGSPSPVIEEGRVYIHFGSYGTAAIDTATGKEVWRRTDLPCRHFRGPGSSPFLYKELLILTMDGVDHQYLVALNKATGENVWRTERSTEWKDIEPDGSIKADGDLRKAYTTPTLTKAGDKTILISPGAKACFAYEPDTGKELWHLTYGGYSNASRTVIHDGYAYINTGFGKPHLLRVRLDPNATGDITDSHVEWDIFKRIPKRSSPIIADGALYVTTDEGIVSRLDLETGKEVWNDRIRGHFSASPILAEGRLYFFSEMGHAYALKPGDQLEVLATNFIDDAGFMASPLSPGARSTHAAAPTSTASRSKLERRRRLRHFASSNTLNAIPIAAG